MDFLDAPRKLLLELLADNPDHDMKSLSALLGRNAAYIQQYIQKGSPKSLDEDARDKIGSALGISPDALRPEGDAKRRPYVKASSPLARRGELVRVPLSDISSDDEASHDQAPTGARIQIPEYDVSPHAGAGAFVSGADYYEAAPPSDLWTMPKRLVSAFVEHPSNLVIIRVTGDSMEPDYMAGERVMVDMGHTIPSPPGVYVLHDGMGLVLKRVEVVFGSKDPVLLRISSINPGYGTYERELSEVHINGRVVGKWVWK
ncbi:helix-turn-helix transcriptional regulator [Acetobacter sacchari]|uniref:Helix-turn-helix transcriptional regulator n=1 Tax=Acetobacter sacchari TaxID=2661687 RepID=A0ABS3M1Q7_9PROT|nr:helix-turn-helix transcriptional regulator [Acetobacter sacchari]MBO1362074.1 helix-turn-helix transcriptional regulator [Acetobacter sacchari]